MGARSMGVGGAGGGARACRRRAPWIRSAMRSSQQRRRLGPSSLYRNITVANRTRKPLGCRGDRPLECDGRESSNRDPTCFDVPDSRLQGLTESMRALLSMWAVDLGTRRRTRASSRTPPEAASRIGLFRACRLGGGASSRTRGFSKRWRGTRMEQSAAHHRGLEEKLASAQRELGRLSGVTDRRDGAPSGPSSTRGCGRERKWFGWGRPPLSARAWRRDFGGAGPL